MNSQYMTTSTVSTGWYAVEHIFKIIDQRGYIAGSYAASMINRWFKVPPGDIDVFAISDRSAIEIKKDLVQSKRYYEHVETDVAFSLTAYDSAELPIQVIKPNPSWTSFPTDIVESFDFDICSAILIERKKVLHHINVGCQEAKILRINSPLRTLRRVIKYQKRGVEFNDHELLKVFSAWDQVDAAKKAALLEQAAISRPELDEPYDSGNYDSDDYFDGE